LGVAGSNHDAKIRDWSLDPRGVASASSFDPKRELIENREDVEGRGASEDTLGEPVSMAAVISGSSLFVRLNIRPMRLAADLAVGLRLMDVIDPGIVGD